MIYLVALGCLALGVIIGVLTSSYMSSGPTRVKELESQIRTIKERHREYKDSVSDHFGMTAELIQHMTESYREVYQHLASGAQDLCSSDVANKLLPADSDAVFDGSGKQGELSAPLPPRDYAAKESPHQKGALSEDFGIEKSRPVDFKPELKPVPTTKSTNAVEAEPTFQPDEAGKENQQETVRKLDVASNEETVKTTEAPTTAKSTETTETTEPRKAAS